MKKNLLLGCLSLSLATMAPSATLTFIDTDAQQGFAMDSIREMASKEGWVIVQHQLKPYLLNYSNPDYDLSLAIRCQQSEHTPKYLIEYSSHYRDGSFGGVDFLSSSNHDHDKVTFMIDGVTFDDPFSPTKTAQLSAFTKALKTGKILTIKVYDQTFNPDTGSQQLSLNRAIEFKLGQPALLDTAIDCSAR